jgi:hypothetical protein
LAGGRLGKYLTFKDLIDVFNSGHSGIGFSPLAEAVRRA